MKLPTYIPDRFFAKPLEQNVTFGDQTSRRGLAKNYNNNTFKNKQVQLRGILCQINIESKSECSVHSCTHSLCTAWYDVHGSCTLKKKCLI